MSAAKSDFTAVIHEMRAHYTSSREGTTKARYAPSPEHAHFFTPVTSDGDARAAKAPEVVAPLAEQAKESARALARSIEDKLLKDAQEMKAGDLAGNLYSYVIDAVRAQNRQEARHAIESLFDAGQAVGLSHPDHQPAVASSLLVVSDLLREVAERIDEHLVGILKDILAWLPQAHESTKEAFAKLSPWIEGSC